MNTSLRDLGERAGAVPVPQLDVAALVAAGDSRIRRRRLAAVAAITVAVVLVVGGAVLALPGTRQADPPPAHDRTHSPDDDTVETRPANRQVTYSVGGVIHWGDRTIDVHAQTRGTQVERHSLHYLDATDDGVVFVVGLVKPERDASGKVVGLGFGASAVWFTDGSTPVRIGTTAGSTVRGFGMARSDSGSLVAWKEPGDETSPLLQQAFGPVVVYDTARMREVARFGGPNAFPLGQVYADAVFWVPDARSCRPTQFGPVDYCRASTPVMRLDVATGAQTEVTWTAYEAERTSRPGLLTGPDHRPSGCISCVVNPDGLYRSLSFVRRGHRLVLGDDYGLRFQEVPFTPTVALTGQPLRLRLPARYEDAERWQLVQWLDPDRVVLLADGEPAGVTDRGKTVELLVCGLSTGDCRIAAGTADGVFTPPGEAGRRG